MGRRCSFLGSIAKEFEKSIKKEMRKSAAMRSPAQIQKQYIARQKEKAEELSRNARNYIEVFRGKRNFFVEAVEQTKDAHFTYKSLYLDKFKPSTEDTKKQKALEDRLSPSESFAHFLKFSIISGLLIFIIGLNIIPSTFLPPTVTASGCLLLSILVGWKLNRINIKYTKIDLKKLKIQLTEKEIENNKFTTQKNQEVDALQKDYETGIPKAVSQVLERLLTPPFSSVYKILESFDFEKKSQLQIDFDSQAKIAIVTIQLPNEKYIPREIDHKYIPAKDQITSKMINDKEFSKLYDRILCQLVLLYPYFIFKADYQDIVQTVVLNGHVKEINKASGKPLNNCIVSVAFPRDQFETLHLENVDPVECLKLFKARISSEFINMAAVTPILTYDKSDNRFIETNSIINDLSAETNLATH